MKQQFFLLSMILLFSSCKEKIKQHNQLVGWSRQFVAEGGPGMNDFYNDHAVFIKQYFTNDTHGDTLIVTTLKEVNACGNAIANITISNDSIYLLTNELSDILCTSSSFNTYTYKIYNPEKKQYVIVSE